MLRNIKYRHGDGERIADKRNRDERLEYPFEEYPCLKVRQVIVINDQLDQLVTGNECQDYAGNRHDYRFRYVPDHRVDARRKCRRGRAYFR